jgi:4a-hydroxytetrahydrobiopterin dehydratase
MVTMTELLADDQLDAALVGLSDWRPDAATLVRTVELADFPTAIAVVDRVAELAEKADHHPDIDIRWRTLTFRLSTHSAGGVTAKDIDLAAAIDEVIATSPRA